MYANLIVVVKQMMSVNGVINRTECWDDEKIMRLMIPGFTSVDFAKADTQAGECISAGDVDTLVDGDEDEQIALVSKYPTLDHVLTYVWECM